LLQDIELDTRLLALLHDGVRAPEPKHDDDVVPTLAEVLAKMLRVELTEVYGGMMRLHRRHVIDV
jgi:hypothetical protein